MGRKDTKTFKNNQISKNKIILDLHQTVELLSIPNPNPNPELALVQRS